MIDYEYDAMRKRHCESLVREQFHLHLPVDELLFDDIETGVHSYAVLFRSGRHLYGLFVSNDDKQTLGDVRSMMQHMGITAGKILPPLADPLYFTREARKHASSIFPAIKTLDPKTVRFYESHANYAPGLVRIAKINGPIKRYVPSISNWQQIFDFSFRKIQVL